MLATPAGQQVMARTAAMVSGAPVARLAAASAPNDEATVEVSRDKAILAPAMTVAALDAAPVALARDVSAPRLDQVQPVASSQPIQTASASAAPASAPPAARSLDPATAKDEAEAFVKSYAALTKANVTARWAHPICVRVVGLAPDQEAAVRTRVEEVALAAGVDVIKAKNGCGAKRGALSGWALNNIEIGFTNDPQGMLDGVIKGHGTALGDRTSNTRDIKTVSLPIQAWYLTNGVEKARYDTQDNAGGLKIDIRYQATPCNCDLSGLANGNPGAGMAAIGAQGNFYAGSNAQNAGQGSGYDYFNFQGGVGPTGPAGPAGPGSGRWLGNVFVIVDGRRVGDKSLGLIADYVAMVALSQPTGLDHCNAVPSITDLFAACPGRGTPDGLTPADAAYLTALYQDKNDPKAGRSGDIADRMAKILAGGSRMASN
ncbi:MAG: hypothetical protein WDN45_03865 [Caulobacteraceae bacterium]